MLPLIFLLVFSPWASSSEKEDSCKHDEKTFRCVTYLKNYDADTITVSIPETHPLIGKKIGVRVLGVDTPEMKTKNKCEKQAATYAKHLVEKILKKAKRIDLVNIDRDKYFRILADVVADGQNLKEVLLKNHLAYAYDGGTKKKVNWCVLARKVSSEFTLTTKPIDAPPGLPSRD